MEAIMMRELSVDATRVEYYRDPSTRSASDPADDGLVLELRSELAATRSELERKDALARSLQARLHQMERRCLVLEENLKESNAREKELKEEAFEARLEVTNVWNELHSRRSNSVVDAEIAFAEEMQRVEANAKREVDTLREKAGALRAALEERTSLYREACSERDIARHEAEEAAEKISNLRQEVKAEAQAEAEAGAKAVFEMFLRERMANLKEEMKEQVRLKTEMILDEIKTNRDVAMRQKLRPLLEELQKSQREKARLGRLVKEHSNRAKAIELENGRLLRGIDELHDSTMAIVLQTGINIGFPR